MSTLFFVQNTLHDTQAFVTQRNCEKVNAKLTSKSHEL